MGGRTTLSVGMRYDLEIIPLDEDRQPVVHAAGKDYPVDRNNISPRIGFTHSLDEQGKSVHARRLRACSTTAPSSAPSTT